MTNAIVQDKNKQVIAIMILLPFITGLHLWVAVGCCNPSNTLF